MKRIGAAMLGLALAAALPRLAWGAPPPESRQVADWERRTPGWIYRLRMQRILEPPAPRPAEAPGPAPGAGATVVGRWPGLAYRGWRPAFAPVLRSSAGAGSRTTALDRPEEPGPAPPELAAVGSGDVSASGTMSALAREGLLNVLLLGSDRRPNDGGWRTDSILLVSIDKAARRAGMVSIPRDLWVDIPGAGLGRINTADYLGTAGGGEDGALIKETVARNLGVPVHRFIRVDFQAFVTVVDALNGIDVVVDCPLEDYFLWDGVSDAGVMDLTPGIQRLNGITALRYARSRHSTSDFDRSRRQQRLLRAMLARAKEQGLMRSAPRILASVREHVQTDLSLPELVALAALAIRFDDVAVRAAQLDTRQLRDWTTDQGAMVLVMEPAAVRSTLDAVLLPELAPDRATHGPGDAVALVDQTGRAAWDQIAAMRLLERGVSLAEVRFGAPEAGSAVYYAAGAEAVADEVADALDLGGTELRPMEELPTALQLGVDVQVALGADWVPTCR